MKKILKNFAESLISRDQMKKIKGGCESGTCDVSITCSSGSKTISCGGSNGKCKSSNNEVPEWVQCDNDSKVYC